MTQSTPKTPEPLAPGPLTAFGVLVLGLLAAIWTSDVTLSWQIALSTLPAALGLGVAVTQGALIRLRRRRESE